MGSLLRCSGRTRALVTCFGITLASLAAAQDPVPPQDVSSPSAFDEPAIEEPKGDEPAHDPAHEPAPTPDEPPPAPRGEVPPRVASYTLLARLDPQTHEVHGEGTLRFTNASATPATDLYFHLYLNAFRSDRTLFLRSPHTRSRSGYGLGEPGSVEVRRLTAPRYGAQNLWERAATHSPDDPEDATDIRVPLPEPIAPGETVEFTLEFTSKLPRIVERTGFARSFHMVAQWFPKLARREPDGRWAHFAFHPHAEFYADFGEYDVTVDVPRKFVVGATGRRVSSEEGGGRRRERYVARGVHDFAWCAWDEFETEERSIAGVDVTLLAPPHTAPARKVTWEALTQALPFLGERYGAYPHPTLTVVHPPDFATGAGGMEYPTLITTGGRTLWPRLGIRLIEQVTVHELAHQWFQGLLASNEYAWPFLDEGLTTYAEWEAMRAAFGPGSAFDRLGLTLSLEAVGRAASVYAGRQEPIAQPAAAFTSMRSLAAHVYSGTGTALTTIARVYGQERLETALRAYALAHRFGHPTPEDLLQHVGTHVGDDAAEALRAMLFDRATLNYQVLEVTSSPVRDENATEGAKGAEYVNRAVIARRGSLRLPTTVRLDLEDGTAFERRLSGKEPTFVLESRDRAPLARVTVDPERALLWDDDLLDNTRSRGQGSSKLRTSERAAYVAELLLHLLTP